MWPGVSHEEGGDTSDPEHGAKGDKKGNAETHKSPAQKGRKKEETACYSDSRTKEGEGRKLGRESSLSNLGRGEAREPRSEQPPPLCPSNLVHTRPSPLFLPLLINRHQGGASRSGRPPTSLAVRLRETGKSPEGERAGEQERRKKKARGCGVCGLEMHEAAGNNKKKCTAEKGSRWCKGPAGITAEGALGRSRAGEHSGIDEMRQGDGLARTDKTTAVPTGVFSFVELDVWWASRRLGRVLRRCVGQGQDRSLKEATVCNLGHRQRMLLERTRISARLSDPPVE